jgi:hypothetical protein
LQKILLALERVRRHLVEKKGKEEVPLVRKRERLRLLVNLLGMKADQDSAEVWEERRPSLKEGAGSGVGGMAAPAPAPATATTTVDKKEAVPVEDSAAPKEEEDKEKEKEEEKNKEKEESPEEGSAAPKVKTESGENVRKPHIYAHFFRYVLIYLFIY